MIEFNNKINFSEEDIHPYKAKKFVVQVFDDNIELIDDLPSDQKNYLINNLLRNYRIQANSLQKKERTKSKFKKSFIVAVLVLIGVPLFIMLVNFSIESTLKSYSIMEQNFQKLFD